MKEKVVSPNELQFIGADDEIAYLSGEDTPFTGKVECFYDNGQKVEEGNYKDGKLDGLYTSWYENGQKREETNWRDDKLMAAFVWKPNGEKCPVTNVDKHGTGIRIWYKDDGTEDGRWTFKHGEIVEDYPS